MGQVFCSWCVINRTHKKAAETRYCGFQTNKPTKNYLNCENSINYLLKPIKINCPCNEAFVNNG